jgi:glycosyltransferase involved in cell wall biosynthesis
MITLLIPAFNEELNIASTFATLLDVKNLSRFEFNILIVNDGSTDGTEQVVAKWQKSPLTIDLISLEYNQGQGAAIREGVKQVNTKYFLIIPADDDLSAEAIIALMQTADKVNIAVGYYDKSLKRASYRKLLSKLYSFFICKITGVNIKYINGPALYTTEIAKNLNLSSRGFTLISEMTSKSLHEVALYTEVCLKPNSTTSIPGTSFSLKTIKEIIGLVFRFTVGRDRNLRKKSTANFVKI